MGFVGGFCFDLFVLEEMNDGVDAHGEHDDVEEERRRSLNDEISEW